MSIPAWVERYKESVALSPDDFKMAEALSIAWEALEYVTNLKYNRQQLVQEAVNALRRIEEMK